MDGNNLITTHSYRNAFMIVNVRVNIRYWSAIQLNDKIVIKPLSSKKFIIDAYSGVRLISKIVELTLYMEIYCILLTSFLQQLEFLTNSLNINEFAQSKPLSMALVF